MRHDDLIWATCLSGLAACSPAGGPGDIGEDRDGWTPDARTLDAGMPDDAPTGIDAAAAETWHRCCFPFPGSRTRMTSGFLECSCPAGVICNYEIQTCFSDTGLPVEPFDSGFADAGPMDDASLDALLTGDGGTTP